ncbi:uncharacterized protein LOC128186585 isoform X2 [Crassostrea angulata]|uniref:uncharacterized protein LOC128186585 isoform X2 n=1 Tax=Magallana angulata TaxID=2784310 RepID=UPI0022B1E2B5|nr:uncharacterized protein LOC128186585 isoform X2 [Crassostrea angulata]
MATSLPTSQHSTTQEVYGKSTSLNETNTSTKANWISIMTSSTLLRDHSTTASMNMSVSEMPSTVTVMAADNTTVNYTTTDIISGQGIDILDTIWGWFMKLDIPTRIVIITLLGLVVLLAIGIFVCCCCCKRHRCGKSNIMRSDPRRVCSEERHYTLPTRLTKLGQDLTRRISSMWMDREADGESDRAVRTRYSPRKDRTQRMPSPTPSTTDRPYMDMSLLRRSNKEQDVLKSSDDTDNLSSKGYVEVNRKPQIDRKNLPLPPPKPHPKLANTDGNDSLRLKNVTNVMGSQDHPVYNPQMPAVNFQIVPSLHGPTPSFSACQQCTMGSMCSYAHGAHSVVPMSIQQPPVSQPMNMFNNRIYMPEESCSSSVVYTYGQGSNKPPWKGMIGHPYYNENLPYGHCIPEVTEDSEERDNSSNIPSFGFHNETNSKKTNFYSLDKFQSKKEKHSYDNLQDQEPMYSDPIEPTKGDRWKEPQKGAPKPRSRKLKAMNSIGSARMSMDLK